MAGTLCEGEVQGSFALKCATCMECQVFQRVRNEQGAEFTLLPPSHHANALVDQFTAIMSIIDALNAVVYVADFDTHTILFVNPYTDKLFGGGLVGTRCWQTLQKSQTGPCAFCTNDRLVVDGQPGPPVVWEFQNTMTGRWFLCIDKAIPWVDGRLVRMEVAVDISERKLADQFRDQYINLVSHDLRNPLNAILLHAQVLQRSRHIKELQDESESLDSLVGAAKRMNALINDLVETTRLESGKIELRKLTLDLNEWIAGVVGLVSASERSRIEFVRSPERVMVHADVSRLDRILENLVSNALKYSGDKPVVVGVRRHDNEAIVSVKDQGVGIHTAELARVFERFYRARTAGEVPGLGLGLYNARLMIEAHGGRIWAESQVGQGATFQFALPLAPAG